MTLVEFIRARPTIRRIALIGLWAAHALIAVAFGFFAMMFVASEMAGPAAAYAFAAGVLTVPLAAKLWRWVRS